MRSFIVTGASACGKTTLVNEAQRRGYIHLPTHTTRAKRSGEIAGVHNEFLTLDEFKSNFSVNMYLEPSLKYAENIGVFYGTPRSWLQSLSHDGYCATPITPLIARRICASTNVLWICLICSEEVRRQRLAERNINDEEIEARIRTIEDQYDLPETTLIFDTTNLLPSQIFTKIAGLL